LQNLLDIGGDLEDVASIAESRIDEGQYFLTEPLSILLAKTHRLSLYEKASRQLAGDYWSLIRLYKERFPDPEIEQRLVKELYRIFKKDDEPLRRAIVSAFTEVGSSTVLPTLEAIAHDLEPSAISRNAFGSTLGMVEGFAGHSRYTFFKEVISAIEVIQDSQDEAASGKAEDAGLMKPSSTEKLGIGERHKKRAERYLEDDPENAVIHLRKGAESIAKDVYRQLGLEKAGRPPSKMNLEELLTSIKQEKRKRPPDLLQALLQTFQHFGNFASHDQEEEEAVHFNAEISQPLYRLFVKAIEIHRVWVNQMRST
jgi:hypothetical protein